MAGRRVVAVTTILGGWVAAAILYLLGPGRCADLCRRLAPGQYCLAVCRHEPELWVVGLSALIGVAATASTLVWLRRSSKRNRSSPA